MAKHLETGQTGERLAAEYLRDKGYQMAALNFRSGRGEIDLIAWSPEHILVFVEVKTRNSMLFGGPVGAISAKKQELMARTAAVYMEQIGYDWEIRFDVIAILQNEGRPPEIRHIEDAFF